MTHLKTIPIGEVLKEQGYINDEQLQQALAAQKKDRSKRLGQHLIDLGFVTEEQTLHAMSEKLGQPFINIDQVNVDIEAVSKIPEALAKKYKILGFGIKGNVLQVVTSDPMNFYGFEDIRLVTGMDINVSLGTTESVLNAIEYYYSEVSARKAADIANKDSNQFQMDDEELFNSENDDSPVVKLLNSILMNAFNSNVSDIHIEPFEKETIVRMRIELVLIFLKKEFHKMGILL